MNIIAIYPGRFQPFGKHHGEAFKWLLDKFGTKNTYIATSNSINPPKSPFSFKEKSIIIKNYGYGKNLKKVTNPYKCEEILEKFDPADTAVVFMVGQKDMAENPRFKISKTSYFQDYEKNKKKLKGFDKHGYLVVAPHVNITIPGFGEMSGTTLRKALGAPVPRVQKIDQFKAIFGWYDKKTADMIFDKLEMKKQESKLFSKNWWGESLELNEAVSIDEMKGKLKKFIEAVKQEGRETKEAFSLVVKAAAGDIQLTDAQKKQIGDQLKDVLKTVGLVAIALAPGGIIVGILLKVLKADKFVTPSAFMSEDKKDKDDPCWKGYRQYGMKKKGNKQVPNCVPVDEGYFSPKLLAKHNAKIDKLKKFLHNNIGREFVYNFDEFPKTAVGVNMSDLQEQLLFEGGAGGHMHHVFDIEWVKTGKDLLDVFNMSVDYLNKKPAAVKIDGVNASVRLVKVDRKYQFVMDRGSNKPLDVKGITKAELEDRFAPGHGMIKVGGIVLDIFNDALQTCMPELKDLGLLSDPNIMFNIEYVAGSTNVLSYNKNFLAIHGLLEIIQVTEKRRATHEIPYSKKVLQKLLNKLNPIAQKYGYEVVGSIPTTLSSQPTFNSVLNKNYTINYGTTTETKTLKKWLSSAKVPKDLNVKTVDGKSIGAMSKDVLLKLLSNTPLNEFIANKSDYQNAIDGFFIYLATMELGDAVLSKLDSPLGPVSEQEGIVIRDPAISKKPFKITGGFIIKGLSSSFKK